MAGKSIGSLNATITADASQFVGEFRRADEAVRQRAASIGGQVDKLQRDLSRNFSFAKFGKDLLGGFGIGSAAGLTMTLIDHFVEMWRESEQYAKKLEERAQSIADSMRESSRDWGKMVRGTMSPEEQQLASVKDAARLAEQLAIAEEARQNALRGLGFAADAQQQGSGIRVKEFNGEKFVAPGSKDGLGMQVREFGDLMLDRADEAQKRIVAIRNEMRGVAQDLMKINDQITTQAERNQAQQDKIALDAVLKNARPNRAMAFSEISPEARQNVLEQPVRDWMERQKNLADQITRLSGFSGGTRVDDMTRRGLGSGGNYLEIQKQANDYLAEMARTLREIREQGPIGTYAN